HLIVVVAIGSGAAVERSSTGPGDCTVSGPLWMTRITAVNSAPNPASRRILVAITPPRASSAPAGTIQVATTAPDRKREHVLVAGPGQRLLLQYAEGLWRHYGRSATYTPVTPATSRSPSRCIPHRPTTG